MLGEYLRHAARFSPPVRLFLLAQFLYGLGQATVYVLRNLYLEKAGFDKEVIGSTMAASSFGMVAVMALAPRFMDRMRLRGFLAAGGALLGAGLAGVALVPRGIPVMIFCFLSGVGMALFEVASAPFVSRHSREERPYLFGIGMALSPMAGLVAALGVQGGALAWGETLEAYRYSLIGGGAMAMASVAALAFLREAPPDPPPETESGGRLQWKTAFRFALPEAIIGLGAGLTVPLLNLYFSNRFGFGAGTFALLYAGTQVMMMAGFLVAPVLAGRLGAVRTIVLLQLTSVPFFLVLAFAQAPLLAAGAFLLRHSCMNMIHPVSIDFMMAAVPPPQRARVNGLKQLANRIAGVAATWLGLRIVANVPVGVDGFTTVMLATIVLYVVGTFLFWRFFREGRDRLG